MKIDNDLLPRLMQEVDQKLEVLLLNCAEQQQEICRLKEENKYLKGNYAQIQEQIALYIAELETIKHSNT
jgi:hypothetical protein